MRKKSAITLLCIFVLATTLSAAGSLTVPSIDEQYIVTYKDKNNKTIQPVIRENAIFIADPNAEGSLKIKKKKGVPEFSPISFIVTSGTLTKIFSEADIEILYVRKQMRALTTKKSYVYYVRAGGVGKVKMTAFARSNSFGQTFETAIYSGVDGNGQGLRNGPPSLPPTLKCTLNGVGMRECYAPQQTLICKMGTKGWKNPDGQKDVSLAHIPNLPPSGGFMGSAVVCGDQSVVAVTGGGTWSNNDRGFAPELFQCTSTPGAKGCSIKSKGSAFTFTFSSGGHKERYKSYYAGGIYANSIRCGGSGFSCTTSGGDIFATTLQCGGAINTLQAKTKRQVSHSNGDSSFAWYSGGFARIEDLSSGSPRFDPPPDPPLPPFIPHWMGGQIRVRQGSSSTSALPKAVPQDPALVATAAGPSDIKLIRADFGLNWDVVWDSQTGGYTAILYTQNTIRAGENGDGVIGKIQSKKLTDKKLSDEVKGAGGPYICGQGYAARPGKIVGGDSDGYFTWH